MLDKVTPAQATIPFDTARLDKLMDEAGMDVLIATSKHNVQYLLGGHRTFFFDHMEAMGPSRYLPVLAYPRGAPDQASWRASHDSFLRDRRVSGMGPRVSSMRSVPSGLRGIHGAG